MNDLHIPETIWNMGARTADRLSRSSAEQDLVTFAESGGSPESNKFGARLNRADFWSRMALAFTNEGITGDAPHLLIQPAFLQVADCGGYSAEHSDLEFCNLSDIKQNNQTDTTANSNNHMDGTDSTAQSTFSTSVVSNSNSDTLTPTPNVPPNNTTPALPNVLASGDLTFASQCAGASAYCTPFPMEPQLALADPYAPDASTPPIGDQSPLTGDQNPPIGNQDPLTGDQDPLTGDQSPPTGDPLPPIGDPLPPIGDPVPPIGGPTSGGTRPIPEAPTWVMTVIGFGVVAFVFRRKKHSRIKSISIIDNN
jgi:hypothetical protein